MPLGASKKRRPRDEVDLVAGGVRGHRDSEIEDPRRRDVVAVEQIPHADPGGPRRPASRRVVVHHGIDHDRRVVYSCRRSRSPEVAEHERDTAAGAKLALPSANHSIGPNFTPSIGSQKPGGDSARRRRPPRRVRTDGAAYRTRRQRNQSMPWPTVGSGTTTVDSHRARRRGRVDRRRLALKRIGARLGLRTKNVAANGGTIVTSVWGLPS